MGLQLRRERICCRRRVRIHERQCPSAVPQQMETGRWRRRWLQMGPQRADGRWSSAAQQTTDGRSIPICSASSPPNQSQRSEIWERRWRGVGRGTDFAPGYGTNGESEEGWRTGSARDGRTHTVGGGIVGSNLGEEPATSPHQATASVFFCKKHPSAPCRDSLFKGVVHALRRVS
jgi:hypothetical protein